MSYMFNKCLSLTSLPNISKWKLRKNNGIDNIFLICFSLLNIDEIKGKRYILGY